MSSTAKTSTASIALGSNQPSPVGDPEITLEAAIRALSELGRITARSRFYATAPVGYADQPTFLNAAVTLETALNPEALLDNLLAIEQRFGRDRSHGIPNGPRTLDLDLILYGDLVLRSDRLTLPHPRMHQRAFVLEPLTEIAPLQIHPILHRSMKELLHAVTQERNSDS